MLVDSVSVGKMARYTFAKVTTRRTISAGFYLNALPTAPVPLVPADADTVRLYPTPVPVTFTWRGSFDGDATDTLRYSVRVLGPGLDTTVAGLQDTSVSLNIMPRLQVLSTYSWTVRVTDGFATITSPDSFTFRTTSIITAIHTVSNDIPGEYALRQNFPNPFNPSTTIQFELRENANIRLVIYDVLGKEIVTLAQGEREAGYHSVVWDARSAASGTYYARFTATGEGGKLHYTRVNKLLLMK